MQGRWEQDAGDRSSSARIGTRRVLSRSRRSALAAGGSGVRMRRSTNGSRMRHLAMISGSGMAMSRRGIGNSRHATATNSPDGGRTARSSAF